MPLSDAAARNAKPGPRTIRLADGGGLYLEISPRGGKWWRFKYRFGGKEKRLSLGTYPLTTLREAREARDQQKRLLVSGVDPAEYRKAQKRAVVLDGETFEGIAREWFAKFSPRWKSSHSDKVIRRLEKDVFPWIGERPIATINAPELLSVLRRIESRGAVDTAHRAKQNCGQVFRYAIATGRAERDPSADLRGALPPPKENRFPAITEPKRIGELLRALDGYEGSLVTRCALRLAPLVFVRPGELRHAEWSEIDTDCAEWRIPGDKMKSGETHIVPLSHQAVMILSELLPLTGRGRYVFPGVRSPNRPMSGNTVNAALRRLGYAKDEMTGHGFRAMASTVLNEQGWNADAIERQLAHAERNQVRAAYHRAEYLDERRKMMQAWADYLDSLRAGATVVPIAKTGHSGRGYR